ncbi:glycoside hydrolase family 30 beta sandwich domain-containing protein [Spirochaetia bacterium 38H-sp]|uniref:Glycoside hydrolase family 30 beta sandwich domain-containing protein n=1 Tax=Rarispira pelagica TaxID=3141764 RepID=A0ABU9UCY2_9SPIR
MKVLDIVKSSYGSYFDKIENPICDCRINASLKVDLSDKRQVFLGFGTALTEAAAYVLSFLSYEDRKKVIDSYFNKEKGLGLSFVRTHISSCDFSLSSWSCLEKEGDTSLLSFSLEPMEKFQLPLILDVFASYPDLRLFLSPWSPPAWMKTNRDMCHGGKLLPEYRETWAMYFVRFIESLKQHGIDTWAVSVQNEPEAVQTWESCIYTAEEEAVFVRDFLGPALKNNGFDDVRIFIWDHNRDRLRERAEESMSVEGAAEYISGFAYHWYSVNHFENVKYVREKFPDKMLVFTEGCIEGGARPGDWYVAERYARDIIGDINSGVEVWIDWNAALDMQGGPNHVGNYCDSPVLVDIDKSSFYMQPSYYAIAHFSKFINDKATVLGCSLTTENDGIYACALDNNDGTITVVILNSTKEDVALVLNIGHNKLDTCVKNKTIMTYRIKKE